MWRTDSESGFHLPEGDRVKIDEESEESVVLTSGVGGPLVKMRSGALGVPIAEQSCLSLLGSPYETAEAATVAAEFHRERLLAFATRRRVAIDLGDGFVRGGFTPADLLEAQKRFGARVRNARSYSLTRPPRPSVRQLQGRPPRSAS